jgi:exodeoxyribonuclease-3
MLRIISLNLNGIRSAVKKGFLNWLAEQDADLICVQELRAQMADIASECLSPCGYQGYFHCAQKKGYSGVGIYSRILPDRVVQGLGIEEIDAEGRFIQVDIGKLSVASVYLPSGSSSPERQQVKFDFMRHVSPHLEACLCSGREYVLCGDWNIAHEKIDIKNWKGNLKHSGFLPEERQWLSALFARGWVDVFRHKNPGLEAYTWWSNRGRAWENNVGWRIDYQIATPGIAATALATHIYTAERFSDHAPLIVDYGMECS